jgi:hypothetical protein
MVWWESLTWDWAALTKTAIGAGLGTFIVQSFLTFYRERCQRKLQAAYMAMRLAVILEEFVVKCVYRSWHDDADFAEGRTELDPDLPALACYPEDSDWKSLDPKLAGRVLSFRNEITSAGMLCQFQGSREGNNVASAAETIVAGANAWRLAQDLREKYNLGAIAITHVDFLLESHKKIQQRRNSAQK